MGLDSVLLSVVVADTEIVSQLHSGSFAGQSEQTGNKINCISVRLASETMEVLLDRFKYIHCIFLSGNKKDT